MTYLLWYLIVMAAADGLYGVYLIGRHRAIQTVGDAIINLVIAAAHVAGFFWILGRVG